MKSILGIIVLLLVNLSVFGNMTSIVEPELKVMAKSGLKLRLAPNLESPVIDVINYGASLERLNDFVSTATPVKINWVEGQWIKVKYNGQEGFVFDGYVSKLSAPMEDNEFSSNLNDLSYSMYAWAFNNYVLEQIDTLSESELSTSTITSLSGQEFFMYSSNVMTKVEFTISDIRIMDAYHLLESMMDTRSTRSILKENTVFFENSVGKVNKIRIGDQIEIKLLGDGNIKLRCQSIHEGC